jgi:AraC-like DNA-binding protein
MSLHTGLSAWVLAIVHALEQAGVDHVALLGKLGMDASRVGDLNHRYLQHQVTDLWKAAVEATGDSNFGLKVARQVRPSTFHVIGYAMACSGTLARAAERFAHSARLISDSAKVDFLRVREGLLLVVDLNTGGEPPIYQTIDTILAGFLLLCEWIGHRPVVPLEVCFRHEQPADDSEYRAVFRCPILYGQRHNSLLFKPEDLDQPIPAANEELAMLLDEMAAKYLATRFDQRFSRQVRDSLVAQLPAGQPSKMATARALNMTERTLLRRLHDENTTFKELLDKLREELAYDYLRREDLSLETIADLLGFSSSSTFSRAFVQWTGKRPSDWRQGYRNFGWR